MLLSPRKFFLRDLITLTFDLFDLEQLSYMVVM